MSASTTFWTAFLTELLTIYEGFLNASWSVASPNNRSPLFTARSSKLFNDVELRLLQSLILCKDLSSLMRFVRLAQAKCDPDVLRSVTARILEFRDGSMQYLMYKDWRGYESLALEVITAIENNLDPKPLLHRFICYLEVLYGHVKMRAVLADDFPYSGRENEQ